MDSATLRRLHDVWRVVSQHDEVQTSADALWPLITDSVPLSAMALWRYDRERNRLTPVVAVGRIPADPTRIDLDGPRGRAFAEWCTGTSVQPWTPATTPEWARGAVAGPTVAVALLEGKAPTGLATFFPTAEPDLAFLALLAEPLSIALRNDTRLHELKRLREAAEADRRALLDRLDRGAIADTIIGADTGLSEVMRRVRQVAVTDAPVMLFGETGSGKELVARAIHDASTRQEGPFLKINCGAIPPELVDSELFGHEKGSFTGATGIRRGWFERADGGTLFLDEIGELPLPAQVRMLRVLQDGSFVRVGGERVLHADVRVVAATHRDLANMAQRGDFRTDLWYRLAVFPIHIPPLRARRDDIPELARFFAARAGRRLVGRELEPSPADLAALGRREWPGNVRELAAVIERAIILGDGQRLDMAQALGPEVGPRPTDDRAAIEEAVARCLGRIEGPFGAAAALGVNAATLRSRMRRFGIDWEKYRRKSELDD